MAAIDLGSKPMEASILGSMEARVLGSRPMEASILGSRPVAAAMAEAVDIEAVVLEDPTLEALGDEVLLCSSLLALALEGGRGDGEALEVRGDWTSLDCDFDDRSADLEADVEAAEDTGGRPIIPCMPGMPIPYMAAMLGSMAAMATIRLELGFLGSSPKADRAMGSICRVLGSMPRAASMAGSNFLGSIPMAANMSV